MAEDFVFARSAVSEDLDRISALVEHCKKEISGRRGGDAVLASQPDLGAGDLVSGWLESPKVDCIVAGVSDCTLGFAVIDWTTGGVCELQWIYVAKEARNVGVGAALLDNVLRLASANGCRRIDSIAFPGDAKTKNFFESYGMKARLLTISKDLD